MTSRGALTTGLWQQAVWGNTPKAGLWARIRRVVQVCTTRHLLTEMDDRMLADVGISRSDAMMEANRAPWDTMSRSRS